MMPFDIVGELLMTIERFSEIVEEEMALLPDYVFDELNGGVIVDERVNMHPESRNDDLYIMGTYSSGDIPGKQVTLYYGSFMVTMPGASEEEIGDRIRETLRHEFLHHLETKAGLFGKGSLIEEDRDRMIRYYSV